MSKRFLSFVLTLMLVLGTCFASFPPLTASASFKNGETITITDKAGGGVYPEGSSALFGDDVPVYQVSAMSATNVAKTASYYAWCASYDVFTPAIGREYVLYDHENAGTTTINGKRYNLVNYISFVERTV